MLRSVRGTPTVLLAHGQNMRSHWTWLQDGNVVADKFRGGHAPARRLDPDLRIVRVRSARGRETAQWWGLNPDPNSANGLPAHLWTDPSATLGETRVFWSTTPKAQTFKLSVAADKLAPRVNTKGKLTIDTGEAAWNPGLVEVSVLGCHPQDGDVPEALALAVHQLRQAPDLPDALSLPLPLHLAGLSQEYVLPTRAEEDSAPKRPRRQTQTRMWRLHQAWPTCRNRPNTTNSCRSSSRRREPPQPERANSCWLSGFLARAHGGVIQESDPSDDPPAAASDGYRVCPVPLRRDSNAPLTRV